MYGLYSFLLSSGWDVSPLYVGLPHLVLNFLSWSGVLNKQRVLPKDKTPGQSSNPDHWTWRTNTTPTNTDSKKWKSVSTNTQDMVCDPDLEFVAFPSPHKKDLKKLQNYNIIDFIIQLHFAEYK